MSSRPHIVFVASECSEFFKSGGLADVASALPNALIEKEVKVSTILPYFSLIDEELKAQMQRIATFNVNIAGKETYCGLMYIKLEGKDFYFIENDDYFKRDNLYGYGGDDASFIYFSFAAVTAIGYLADAVDIIHCHDWQTAAIPVILNAHYKQYDLYRNIKTVFTIHNLRFQGKLNKDMAASLLGISQDSEFFRQLEKDDTLNLLKGALYNADYITTVSDTYAEEIKTAYYGEELNDILSDNAHKLLGIVNGLDVDLFDPANDAKIYEKYTTLAGKAKNKQAFAKEFKLANAKDMVISIVTRLDRQKGLDLILHVMDDMMDLPVQFVLLGTGEKKYEEAFAHIERKYGNRCKCFIMYSDEIARKIYAASDLFLMPSDFEPCGLSQLISMRYGTVPLVRETGGLKDTVAPYNKYTGQGAGFSFANYNAHEMLNTVEFAYDVYTNYNDQWQAMCWRNMAKDFSWNQSAEKYINLYKELIGE